MLKCGQNWNQWGAGSHGREENILITIKEWKGLHRHWSMWSALQDLPPDDSVQRWRFNAQEQGRDVHWKRSGGGQHSTLTSHRQLAFSHSLITSNDAGNCFMRKCSNTSHQVSSSPKKRSLKLLASENPSCIFIIHNALVILIDEGFWGSNYMCF